MEQLAAGRQALENGDWAAARAAFEAALASNDTPDAHDGLGQALWFLDRPADGVAERERAFDGYAGSGRCEAAARVAVWVSHQYSLAGRSSAARGWLSRAERALEGVEPCAGHGWVALERARHAASVEDRIALNERAMAIARDTGAQDLEVFAISQLGRAEVAAGRREPGMGLLEEAMAAASSGRVHDVHTVGEAYCNLVVACADGAEWERAREWCELVDGFARGHDFTPLLGACRTAHADVLLATGRWAEAEQALASAMATHAGFVPAMAAPTAATMAELRIRQGRLAEAEQLLVRREEHPALLRALAHLRLAEGDASVAATLLERGLAAAEGDVMESTRLLALLVEAGDARAAAVRLAQLAEQSGSAFVVAHAHLAAARAAQRPPDAAETARKALAAFGRLAMPLAAAEARLVLARAVADEAPELAREEARTALATFRELGASRAMDSAAAVLRELGGGTAARARSHGELTAREQEVLELVALGMSNARIAQTLVISEKTAGHHVSRILSKLGVRNRAEAAAHAARSAAAR